MEWVWYTLFCFIGMGLEHYINARRERGEGFIAAAKRLALGKVTKEPRAGTPLVNFMATFERELRESKGHPVPALCITKALWKEMYGEESEALRENWATERALSLQETGRVPHVKLPHYLDRPRHVIHVVVNQGPIDPADLNILACIVRDGHVLVHEVNVDNTVVISVKDGEVKHTFGLPITSMSEVQLLDRTYAIMSVRHNGIIMKLTGLPKEVSYTSKMPRGTMHIDDTYYVPVIKLSATMLDTKANEMARLISKGQVYFVDTDFGIVNTVSIANNSVFSISKFMVESSSSYTEMACLKLFIYANTR